MLGPRDRLARPYRPNRAAGRARTQRRSLIDISSDGVNDLVEPSFDFASRISVARAVRCGWPPGQAPAVAGQPPRTYSQPRAGVWRAHLVGPLAVAAPKRRRRRAWGRAHRNRGRRRDPGACDRPQAPACGESTSRRQEPGDPSADRMRLHRRECRLFPVGCRPPSLRMGPASASTRSVGTSLFCCPIEQCPVRHCNPWAKHIYASAPFYLWLAPDLLGPPGTPDVRHQYRPHELP
jgi:hypothetical protein